MKTKLRIVFSTCAALSVFAALAFLNNVVAMVRWWRLFLAAGGDTTDLPARAPGLFGWLDWSAVDYSAVTTLIPLIGILCLTRAAWRLLRGRYVKAEDFPFFRGSDQLHIALGLFGTLWGIIVIGYFKLETVTMADLMQCLHTALFSTLMAVVWVFLVDRPLVRPFFLRLLASVGLTETEDDDLAAAVGTLVADLSAASEAFERRQRDYEAAMAKREAEYSAAFERRQRDYEAAMEQRSGEYAAAFERRLAEYEKGFAAREKEYHEFFERRIAELESKAAESDRRAAAALAKVAAMTELTGSWK